MKKTNRMIAMALAAAVTTSAVPTTAFAEGTEGGGSTTTTTSNSDGGSTTTTTSSTESGSSTGDSNNGSSSSTKVTVTVSVTTNADGAETKKSESTTTTNTNTSVSTKNNADGSTTVNTSDKKDTTTETDTHTSEYKREADTQSTDKEWDNTTSSSTTVPDDDNNTPGEPTGGNATNADLNKDGNVTKGEEFANGFQEGTTNTSTTNNVGSNTEQTTHAVDHKNRPIEDSGSSSGQQVTTKVEQTVVRFETPGDADSVDDPNTPDVVEGTPNVTEGTTQTKDNVLSETQPHEVEGSTLVDEDSNQAGTDIFTEGTFVDGKTETLTPTLPNAEDVELEYNSNMDLTIQVDDPTKKVTKTAEESWKGIYDAMVAEAFTDAADKAKAAAETLTDKDGNEMKDANGNPIQMTLDTSKSSNVDDNTRTFVSTYNVTSADGKVVTDVITKEVTVVKTVDENGVASFTTTTTWISTPQTYDKASEDGNEVKYFTDDTYEHQILEDSEGFYFMDGETRVALEQTDGEGVFTYKYGDNVYTSEPEKPHVETTYTLPEKPEPQNSTEADAEGNWREYKVVEAYDAEGKQCGWKIETTVYKVNEAGQRWDIGTGTETIMGTKAVTTVEQKEVEKETTIDTFKQTTTVTEREVQKTTTTEVVNFGMSEFERKMTLQWLGVDEEVVMEDWNTVVPDAYSSLLYTNDSVNNLPAGDKAQFDYYRWYMRGTEAAIPDAIDGKNYRAWIYELIANDNAGDTDTAMEKSYAYCVDLYTSAVKGTLYEVENLADQNYYKNDPNGKAAVAGITAVAQNGFWGTKESMNTLKATVESYLGTNASAKLEEVGFAGTEDVSTITTNLMANPGAALTGTQAAFWKYGTSQTELKDGEAYDYSDGFQLGDFNENASAYTKLVYMALTSDAAQVNANETATQILDAKDIEGATLTAKDKFVAGTDEEAKAWLAEVDELNKDEETVTDTTAEWIENANTDGLAGNDVYDTNVGFTLAVVPTGGDFTVVVKSGNRTVAKEKLSDVATKDEGVYSLSVPLQENVDINVSIEGVQNLGKGVYIYTASNGLSTSQSFVTVAEGKRKVDLDMKLRFNVEEASDVNVSGSKQRKHSSRRDTHTSMTNTEDQEKIVTALVEVTTTTTTVTSEEWDEEYSETWKYRKHTEEIPEEPEPEVPEEPEDPKDPEDPGDPGVDIPDEDVPLADVPEDDGMVLGEEEEPVLIAATGDSNHMAGAFGGMFAALAGMFFLRKKKEQ